MVKKGTWVSIESVVLEIEQRAENLPEDTKNTPLMKWQKGFLKEDAKIGDNVKVETYIGRTEEGKLVEANPFHDVNFGGFVPELLQIGRQVKEIAFGGGK